MTASRPNVTPLLGRDELVEDVGELISEQSCDYTGWTVDANDGNVVRRS